MRREKLLFASGRKSSLVEAGSPPCYTNNQRRPDALFKIDEALVSAGC